MNTKAKKTVEQLRAHVDDQYESLIARVQRYGSDLAKDPGDAGSFVRGIDGMARDVGRLTVAATIRAIYEKANPSTDEILSDVLARTLRGARFNSNRSTSVGTNMLDDATLAAWADLAVWLGAER